MDSEVFYFVFVISFITYDEVALVCLCNDCVIVCFSLIWLEMFFSLVAKRLLQVFFLVSCCELLLSMCLENYKHSALVIQDH